MKRIPLTVPYIVIITISFTLGFYRNHWGVVEMEDVLYRRNVSEIFIMGRLVKSHQDGVFSAGGLLGIGDVSEGNYNNATIQNQYKKYDKGTNFSEYWTYKSQPGFQGMVYGIVDAWTDFAPSTNLLIFRSSVSLALSLILSGVCLWLLLEFGWIASISAAIFILLSRTLAVFGGNLFWSIWSFYLPLLVLAFLLRNVNAKGEYTLTLRFTLVVFFLSLIKILFSGFEFITTALVMDTVPFIYYAVLTRQKWKIFIRGFINLGIGLVGSVLAGLFLLSIQIRLDVGNYKDAFTHIIYSWRNRTYDHGALTYGASDSFKGVVEKTVDVIKHNLNGYAFSLSTQHPVISDLIRDLIDGKYMFLVILFATATVLLLITNAYSRRKDDHQIGLALVVTSWYSALAPLSWFVVFRDHALGHTTLDYIVWEMPFTIFGFALVGYTVSTLIKPRR
jgi:hypothetical protein